MPLLDKPIEELREYMGSGICPGDIDEYWEDALKEMKAVDPAVKLTLSDFQWPGVKCYDMYYTGVKGARIYAKLLKPEKKSANKNPAVIRFHGYYGNSGAWHEYLGFALAGYTVAAMDTRGQGGKSEDTGGFKGTTIKGNIVRGLDDDKHNLMFRHIYLDCAQLAGIIMNMDDVDENRVGCYGNSQGGALTIACAALEPRIKRAAPLHPFLCDYKRVWDMDLDVDAYEELRYFFRAFDPEHKREEEIFLKLGYIDLVNIAKRIKGRVLCGIGLLDNLCPPSTVFAAYNNMICEKEIKVYPDFKHEGMGFFYDDTFLFMKGL
ncbi:MAG: acetylxylan esterase [Clostridiales bacterium]|nr:acetylxylan esterase [Clostridiales bacterium]